MADDDALLALALHKDDGMDVNAIVALLERVDAHLYGIGHLFVVVKQDFLADDLADEKAGWLVGQLVFFEIWR